MHIPDALLDTKTVATGWAVGLPAVGWAVREVRRRMTDGRIVLMAVLAALVFALQMLNFYVTGGTTGHFAGGALAAILLGPWPAVIVITSVLVVQAFVFADGGVTALGANIVNMAVIAPFVGWWVYSAAVRIRGTRGGRVAGAFFAGWTACVAASLSAAVMLWASGRASLVAVAGAMGLWHAIIGVGEGLVTAGLVSYVFAVRPDLMKPDAEVMRTRGLAISLGVLALVAAGFSFLAAAAPDGLEYVARTLGFAQRSAPAFTASPLPDYMVPGVTNADLAGALAGIVGVAVTGALLFGVLRAMRGRRPSAPHAAASVPSPGIHHHEHEHDGEVHRHPHHHAEQPDPPHTHRHGGGFERLTYLVSPVHDLDPRAKIVATIAIVLAIVLSPPPRPLEVALVAALLLAVAALARLPLLQVIARASLVLPFAGAIALLAPITAHGGSLSAAGVVTAYEGGGWIIAWTILAKAWLSVLTTVVLSATTPVPKLIRGLEALHLPDVFITLFTFLHRYVEVLRDQLASLRVALDSRAPTLGRPGRWRLYGNLAGNLLVRSYERGERINAAMLSRGFSGSLPTAEVLHLNSSDVLALAIVVLAAAAIVLY